MRPQSHQNLSPTRRAAIARCAGHLSGVLGLLIFVCFVYVGLMPFQWDPPSWIRNAAEWTESGTLRFSTPGMVRTTAPAEWLTESIERNELRIRLRFRALSQRQFGPSRILTVSGDQRLRNVTIGHEGLDLIVRLRRPESDVNGRPAYVMGHAFSKLAWRELELVVENDRLSVTLDGKRVVSERLSPKPFENWNPDYPLVLGNEVTGDRPWLGEISHATVSVDGREWDYLRADSVETPQWYWKRFKFRWLTRPDVLWEDVGWNLVCFIPFGFFMAGWRGKRGSFLTAVVVCACASLFVECAQTCFAERRPAASDWFANVMGAAIGAACARVWIGRFDRSADVNNRSSENRRDSTHFGPGSSSPVADGDEVRDVSRAVIRK